MTMELSMTLALVAALLIGQFLTALVITFFVLIAEILEGLTLERGRRAIETLIESLPASVLVRRDGRESEIAVRELRVGDTMIIPPGSRVAADGAVLKGRSFVDQASITGEAMPAEKKPGVKVFAGTINRDGVLEVAVEQIGKDTTFGKIIAIVEQAEKSHVPVERLADKLAAWLVYFALGAAALTYLFSRDVVATIAVIIVAGACGVAVGTPLAMLAGIGRSARRGLIVKGGVHLEQLSTVETVIFDKTGTLTFGTPKVTRIAPAEGVQQGDLLQAAATAEQHANHPIAETIMHCARERAVVPEPYRALHNIPGRGVVGETTDRRIVAGTQGFLRDEGVPLPDDSGSRSAVTPGSSVVHVAADGRYLGFLVPIDELRAEARAAVETLHREGYRALMLTGDSPGVAEIVRAKLGVSEAEGGLLPEQKLERVRALRAQGRRVAMVGDGVNDAPALTEANVGIAMGQGTDVAMESADVVLMTNDLSRLVEVLAISRQCRGVIMFNFWGTVIVDAVGIGLAAFGMLSLIAAALVHVGSEMALILNSARLFRER